MPMMEIGYFLGIISGLAVVISATNTSTPTPRILPNIRLPTAWKPIEYHVTIQLFMSGSNASNFKFTGHVKIYMRCYKRTSNVTLHASGLKVDNQSIRFRPSIKDELIQDPVYIGTEHDLEREFLIIKFDRIVENGRIYIIEMNYTSPLQANDQKGLFLSSYIRDNKAVYFAATDFEPTGARRAFPCFDEPSLKATFSLTIIRPENLTSISNMPQKENVTGIIEEGVTYVKDVYTTSRQMSTYLVAFVVSDFQYISRVKNGVLYRAWASPNLVNQTEYALNVTVEILNFFEGFFNICYPLHKQDLIAIPDFSHKATGSWGLLKYRPDLILYNGNSIPEVSKVDTALAVAHVTSQQWFGNLVSLEWWDDIWLIEGFSTLMEYVAVDHIHPEWKIFEKFVIEILQPSLNHDDDDKELYSFYITVTNKEELKDVFDLNKYNKAASILRMLQHSLGYDTFHKGIRSFLYRYKESSISHDQLWMSLQEEAFRESKNIQVKAFMDSWILHMNPPLVYASLLMPRTLQTFDVEQYIFKDRISPPSNNTCIVPFTLSSSFQLNISRNVHWLNTTSLRVEMNSTINTSNENIWIFANVEQTGYYRVNYRPENWRALARQLKTNHQVIPVISRGQLISDAWNLVKARYIEIDIALSLIDYMDKEREYVPLAVATREIYYATKMVANSNISDIFKQFMQRKLNATYHYFLGNSRADSYSQQLARQMIIRGACHYEIQACLNNMHTQFTQWMSNPNNNNIEPYLRLTVYCSAVEAGGDAEWNFTLQMYRNTDNVIEKSNLLYALTCSKNNATLSNLLNLTLAANSLIKIDDGLKVIKYVANKPESWLLAWNFFSTNFVQLKAKYNHVSGWSNIYSDVSAILNKGSERSMFIGLHRTYANVLESDIQYHDSASLQIHRNINWMGENQARIKSWLQTNGYDQ